MNGWDALLLDRLINCRVWGLRCSHGRFHSPITSISKTIRRHLTFQDSLAVEIDISNSQALLLGILALLKRTGRKEGTRGQQPKLYSICDTKIGKGLPNLTADLQHWIEISQAGQTYEFFVERFRAGEGKPYEMQWGQRVVTIDPANTSRKQVKKILMYATFAKVSDMIKNPIWPLLERHFPTMAEFMISEKRVSHKLLAHAYQRFESTMVIDGVCTRIRNNYPSMPLMTIHDCLICPESAASLIENLMTEQFEPYGVEPNLEKKNLGIPVGNALQPV